MVVRFSVSLLVCMHVRVQSGMNVEVYELEEDYN